MRGRLIFRQLAEIHRATAGLEDPDFREPELGSPRDGGDIGTVLRRELPVLRVPCQVDGEATEEASRMFPSGDSPVMGISLLLHFADLEAQGLIDEKTGAPLLGPRDRLGALLDARGRPIMVVPPQPGLYVVETRLLGFGLGSSPRANLLRLSFADRRQAATRFA